MGTVSNILLRALRQYSLFSLRSTGEYHLYKAHKSFDSICQVDRESECGKALLRDSEHEHFSCLDEGDARVEMAKIGRKVCGNCVATLYASQ